MFVYTPTRCGFHEERETKYCSLGICNVYSYVLSEALCPKFGISLSADHLPKLSADSGAVTVRRRNPSKQLARSWMNDMDNDEYSVG